MNKARNTTAHMIAGDSYLERKLNVAPTFPKNILGRHEMITSSDVMRILGLEEGDQIEVYVSHTSNQAFFIVRFVPTGLV